MATTKTTDDILAILENPDEVRAILDNARTVTAEELAAEGTTFEREWESVGNYELVNLGIAFGRAVGEAANGDATDAEKVEAIRSLEEDYREGFMKIVVVMKLGTALNGQ